MGTVDSIWFDPTRPSCHQITCPELWSTLFFSFWNISFSVLLCLIDILTLLFQWTHFTDWWHHLFLRSPRLIKEASVDQMFIFRWECFFAAREEFNKPPAPLCRITFDFLTITFWGQILKLCIQIISNKNLVPFVAIYMTKDNFYDWQKGIILANFLLVRWVPHCTMWLST